MFWAPPIYAHGVVELTGAPGHTCEDWEIGWTQLQFIETNRYHYRGLTPADGSMTEDRGVSRSQLCRDTATEDGITGVFSNTSVDPIPWNSFWYGDPEVFADADPTP
jgi:hypothetical protein